MLRFGTSIYIYKLKCKFDGYRESTSNNRVKSGYEDRHKTPLDKVPDAGSISVSLVISPRHQANK